MLEHVPGLMLNENQRKLALQQHCRVHLVNQPDRLFQWLRTFRFDITTTRMIARFAWRFKNDELEYPKDSEPPDDCDEEDVAAYHHYVGTDSGYW